MIHYISIIRKWPFCRNLVLIFSTSVYENESEFIPRSRECDSMPSIKLALVKNSQALPSIGLDEPRLDQNHWNQSKLEYLLWLNPFHTWQIFGKFMQVLDKYWPSNGLDKALTIPRINLYQNYWNSSENFNSGWIHFIRKKASFTRDQKGNLEK